MDDRMPAVVDFGGQQFQHKFSRVWDELDSGAVVRVINLTTGRLRAWVTLSPPPGAAPVRRSTWYAVHHIGELLDAAMTGGCTEVRDHARGRSLFVHRVMPAALVPVKDILPPASALQNTPAGVRRVEREVVA
jgi:hypothetical protein